MQITSRVVDLLIDRIEADEYPSVSMMDMVEHLADDEQRERYIEVLMAKAEDDEFPSPTMLRRLLRVDRRQQLVRLVHS